MGDAVDAEHGDELQHLHDFLLGRAVAQRVFHMHAGARGVQMRG